MERILDAVGKKPSDVICITQENLPEVMTELRHLWPPESVPPGQIETFMRPLVFTVQDLSGNRPDLKPLLERCPEGTALGTLKNMVGHTNTVYNYHPRELDQKNNEICWPTQNFGAIMGCSHGCLYCGNGCGGKFITVNLNLEEYVEKVVAPSIEKYPWNKCFRIFGWGADLITFEPEYGLFDLIMSELMKADRYGHFHTTSANVDWIADRPYRDRLLGVWSTTCEAVARDIEPNAGSAMDRIEAGRKCQEMGVSIRYKFKPIIPVRNWREEYAYIIEQALKRSNPESIGLCLYIWNNYGSLINTFDVDMLDAEYVEAAREASEEMKSLRAGPFPHYVRAEVYRFFINEVRRWDKDVLLYLCTESSEMWDELKDELGQDPSSYICACSSVAVPGRKLSLSPDFRYSTYSPTPS